MNCQSQAFLETGKTQGVEEVKERGSWIKTGQWLGLYAVIWTHPNTTQIIASGTMHLTPFHCSNPKGAKRLEAKRLRGYDHESDQGCQEFPEINVCERALQTGKNHIKAPRILLLSSQTLRGMNFQRNLNTHKPETMMVFKKAATRQTDWEGKPLIKADGIGLGLQPQKSFREHASKWFKGRQKSWDRLGPKSPFRVHLTQTILIEKQDPGLWSNT